MGICSRAKMFLKKAPLRHALINRVTQIKKERKCYIPCFLTMNVTQKERHEYNYKRKI